MNYLVIAPGTVYGKLTVIKDLGIFKKIGTVRAHHYYLCKCECGREKEIFGSGLISGNSTSCGDCRGVSRKYGAGIERRYQDMISRCFQPQSCNYHNYGARGISVCSEWADPLTGFDNFAQWALSNGFNTKLLLDRIDNDGNYSPDNCRWVNKRLSNINKRPTKNTSGYIGVKRHSSGKGWYGSLKIYNKDFYTGRSDDLITAVKMRNDYIIKNGLSNQLNHIDG